MGVLYNFQGTFLYIVTKNQKEMFIILKGILSKKDYKLWKGYAIIRLGVIWRLY